MIKKIILIFIFFSVILPANSALVIKMNKITPIPEATYKYLDKTSPMYEILQQNKKVIFFSYADHLGPDRKYKWLIDKYLQNHPQIYSKYEYMVFEDALMPAKKNTCKTKQCEENALFSACCVGFCIINPKTKEYIFIAGHNYGLSKRLIEKYKNW